MRATGDPCFVILLLDRSITSYRAARISLLYLLLSIVCAHEWFFRYCFLAKQKSKRRTAYYRSLYFLNDGLLSIVNAINEVGKK